MKGSSLEIKLCPSDDCPLWLLRFGKQVKGVSPAKAIHARCVDCSDGTKNVKSCPHDACPLYPYRFAHRSLSLNTSPHSVCDEGGKGIQTP